VLALRRTMTPTRIRQQLELSLADALVNRTGELTPLAESHYSHQPQRTPPKRPYKNQRLFFMAAPFSPTSVGGCVLVA